MDLKNERLRVTGFGGTLREGSTGLGVLRRTLAAAEPGSRVTEPNRVAG